MLVKVAPLLLLVAMAPLGSTENLGSEELQSVGRATAEGNEADDAKGGPREPLAVRKPTDYLNQHLPKWIRVNGEYRLRVEGRRAYQFVKGADDTYLLSRLRINLNLNPSSWLAFSFQVQDARPGGLELPISVSNVKDSFEIRQGFAGLSFGGKNKVQLKAGRQELSYGTERLVGKSNWSNVGRSFDAVKLELAGEGFRLDVFGSSVVEVDSSGLNERKKGENFYGAYSTLMGLFAPGLLDLYYLRKTKSAEAAESPNQVGEDVNTVGFRLVTSRPGSGWDFSAEAARQWGNREAGHLSAWASYAIVEYAFGDLLLQPVLSAEFSYGSGDSARRGEVGTFDQLYPTNHNKYGILDAVGWRNIQDLRLGSELHLHPRLRIGVDYHSFWLASRHDHLYNEAGSVLVRTPEEGARETHVGQEMDIMVGFTVTPQIRLEGGLAHLLPGSYLEEYYTGIGSTSLYTFLLYEL